ncbi:MAG: histidine kinase [Deltaproteobacteria bacterium HGW-Deltaproteobacteria-14]|nr:MAG: histidine kinase [Deltaproteobacteria bacterium HGW-Deltaproteobacteria-14]
MTTSGIDDNLCARESLRATRPVMSVREGHRVTRRTAEPESPVSDLTELEEAQFRLAIEAAPTGMLMVDEGGLIVLVNAEVERLFGYRREELVGAPLGILVPHRSRQRHPELRRAYADDPQARAMGAGRDLYGLHKDGREVPIEIGLNPVPIGGRRFVLSSIVDISERKRAERERAELLAELRDINASLEERVAERTSELAEREILLNEIHHRVKNNLQVISSLINMQVRVLESPAARAPLLACQTRVEAIALIHEKLYQSDDYARVPFAVYSRSLATNVFRAMSDSSAVVSLDVAMEDVALPMDQAIPCGLILNELIMNALKHGFPGGARGTIRVGFCRSQTGQGVLSVSDDGVGFASDFAWGAGESLGHLVIDALVDQLGGSFTVSGVNGARFELTFPLGD